MNADGSKRKIVDQIDGVKFEKCLESEEFEFPSIVYEFASDRNESVTITVRDAVPDGVPVRDIGFHRGRGKEYWAVEDEQLVFEYTLEPDEEFTTVYACRAGTMESLEDLILAPDEIDVTPSLPSPPDAMTRSSANSPYAQSATSSSQRTDLEAELENDGRALREALRPSPSETPPTDGSLVDRLAREIEDGEASPESIKILRESLLTGRPARGAVDARLRQVETDISDLRAYTGALEDLLAEEGETSNRIDSFETRMHSLEADLKALAASTTAVESEVETVESDLRDVEDAVEEVSNELDHLEIELGELATDLEYVDDRLPAYSIDERFAAVEEKLESVDDFVGALKTALD